MLHGCMVTLIADDPKTKVTYMYNYSSHLAISPFKLLLVSYQPISVTQFASLATGIATGKLEGMRCPQL